MNFRQTKKYKKHTHKDNSYWCKFECIRNLRLCYKKERPEKRIYYDKELNMHFESLQSYRTYEIEVEDVYISLDKEIRKAEDFHRRLQYKYDWIQVERCSNGKITDVENLEKLRTNWELLKKRILEDYEGLVVDAYLEKINRNFAVNTHFSSIFYQYTEYGLLFPPIPDIHRAGWKSEKIIQLDDNADSKLVETITHISDDENIKHYNLELSNVLDSTSSLSILKVQGKIQWNIHNKMIEGVNLSVQYSYDNTIVNEYEFELLKI